MQAQPTNNEHQHYFHEQFQFRSQRSNLQRINLNRSNNLRQMLSSKNRDIFTCISNGNALEIYRVTSQSVEFYQRKQFFCNIRKSLVIPSLHHSSDYVFILDEMGRFTFWNPTENPETPQNQQSKEWETCSIIQKQTTNKRYYLQELSPEDEVVFASSDLRFDVKDTVGFIVFSISSRLIVLKIEVKLKGLKVVNSRVFDIPYTKYRYINCLQNFQNYNKLTLKKESDDKDKFLVGIVQEQEEKTILRIHQLSFSSQTCCIDSQSLEWSLEKINILEFQSGENDEVIVLTYDEISIYRYKSPSNVPICNHRTRGNYGSVCFVDSSAAYIHLGYEIIVFTKDKLTNYGPLRIDAKNVLEEGNGISQCKVMGMDPENGVIIAFVTHFSEVFFIRLFQNTFRLIRKIRSLGSIFSLHPLQQQQNSADNSLVVVHSSSLGEAEVSLVQKLTPTVLEGEQRLQFPIQKSIVIRGKNQGILLVGGVGNNENSFFQLSQVNGEHFFVNNVAFPNEHILACSEKIVVLSSGVYKYTIIERQSQPQEVQNQGHIKKMNLTEICPQHNILTAVHNDSCIGYYTSEGLYKFFDIQSGSVSRIRKNCMQEYIWHMMPTQDILVYATYGEIGTLKVLPVSKACYSIPLLNNELVSSIKTLTLRSQSLKADRMLTEQEQQCLSSANSENENIDFIVGFHTGDIEIYSSELKKTVNKFNIGSEPVQISDYEADSFIVYTPSKQYILSLSTPLEHNTNVQREYRLYQVQMSDTGKCVSSIEYMPSLKKFLVQYESKTLEESSNNHPNQASHQTVISLRSIRHFPTPRFNKQSPFKAMLSDNLQLNSSLSFETIFSVFDQPPLVEVLGRYIYIATSVGENLLKYDIYSKQLIKKQIHLLKQVIGMTIIQEGILLTGVDSMENGTVALFDKVDLMVLNSISIGKQQPFCIKAIKNTTAKPDNSTKGNQKSLSAQKSQQPTSGSSQFFLRFNSTIAVYEVQEANQIIQLKGINTKTTGHSLDIHEGHYKVLVTDPYRYLIVYDYQTPHILPVSKYFGSYMINEAVFLDNAVAYGDRGGNINILEFNLLGPESLVNMNGQYEDITKFNMTNVASLNVGQQVFAMKAVDSSQTTYTVGEKVQQRCKTVYYGCASGSMGRLRSISVEDFRILKQIQTDIVSYIEKRERLLYEQWRNRAPCNDKIIDECLIRYYLEEFKGQSKAEGVTKANIEAYSRVKAIYSRLID